MNITKANKQHTTQATSSDKFVFGKADGSVVYVATDIDTASAWAVDNLTNTGTGVAVFTPTGGVISSGMFLMTARKMIRLRGKAHY